MGLRADELIAQARVLAPLAARRGEDGLSARQGPGVSGFRRRQRGVCRPAGRRRREPPRLRQPVPPRRRPSRVDLRPRCGVPRRRRAGARWSSSPRCCPTTDRGSSRLPRARPGSWRCAGAAGTPGASASSCSTATAAAPRRRSTSRRPVRWACHSRWSPASRPSWPASCASSPGATSRPSWSVLAEVGSRHRRRHPGSDRQPLRGAPTRRGVPAGGAGAHPGGGRPPGSRRDAHRVPPGAGRGHRGLRTAPDVVVLGGALGGGVSSDRRRDLAAAPPGVSRRRAAGAGAADRGPGGHGDAVGAAQRVRPPAPRGARRAAAERHRGPGREVRAQPALHPRRLDLLVLLLPHRRERRHVLRARRPGAVGPLRRRACGRTVCSCRPARRSPRSSRTPTASRTSRRSSPPSRSPFAACRRKTRRRTARRPPGLKASGSRLQTPAQPGCIRSDSHRTCFPLTRSPGELGC